jgi:hypothetical protein
MPDHVTSFVSAKSRACVALPVRYAQKYTAVNCSAVMVAIVCFAEVLISRFTDCRKIPVHYLVRQMSFVSFRRKYDARLYGSLRELP